jgi:hypothetical protein
VIAEQGYADVTLPSNLAAFDTLEVEVTMACPDPTAIEFNWWYGRDGWCPGEEVTPHVWDVTSLVTPGSMATVTYQGQYGGATPPSGGTGNIVLTSYLVTYH